MRDLVTDPTSDIEHDISAKCTAANDDLPASMQALPMAFDQKGIGGCQYWGNGGRDPEVEGPYRQPAVLQ